MIFRKPEEAAEKLKEYFETVPKDDWTITGVALHCGMSSKNTFYEYCKREEYEELFNHARLMVEHSYEMSLRRNGRTGDIFALKNFGWTDKQEIEQLNVNVEAELSESEADEIIKKFTGKG